MACLSLGVNLGSESRLLNGLVGGIVKGSSDGLVDGRWDRIGGGASIGIDNGSEEGFENGFSDGHSHGYKDGQIAGIKGGCQDGINDGLLIVALADGSSSGSVKGIDEGACVLLLWKTGRQVAQSKASMKVRWVAREGTTCTLVVWLVIYNVKEWQEVVREDVKAMRLKKKEELFL
jgi:hypothetical protein